MSLRGTVCCDAPLCDWQADVENIEEWMTKDCPACGTRLMDRQDVAIFAAVQLMQEEGIVRQGGEKSGVHILIDTAELKK